MKLQLFYELVELYKSAPREFQATSYWKSYEKEIFKRINELNLDHLRSGKYQIFKTFGFNEVVYPGNATKAIAKKTILKIVQKFVGNVFPYSITLSDIRKMAYHHCELAGENASAKPISSIETSGFGSPADLFQINNRKYSMWFLNYYLRYCFVNKFFPLKGNEIIVELGSGSGHQIEVLKKLYPDLTILCFDLPAQIFLAESYLTNTNSDLRTVSISECKSWENLDKVKRGHVHFFGNWQFPLLKEYKFDLFWNAASFGEMEPEVVKNYISIIKNGSSHVYLTQARHGKESTGSHHVINPITFENYNEYLSGYKLIKVQDSYQAHKPLRASGGYFDAIWKNEII